MLALARMYVASITYARVDDAVSTILQLGRGALLIKLDLKHAYRIVPVHPDDHHLLGVTWKGHTYIDRALPFGLRSAPKIFSAVADMIAWALHQAGIQLLLHYLDDFLLLAPPTSEKGAESLRLTMVTLKHLGVPVAAHKTEGPASVITFLGILMDTMSFELRLLEDKLLRLRELLVSFTHKRSCTMRELESTSLTQQQ